MSLTISSKSSSSGSIFKTNKLGLDLGYILTPGNAKIKRTSDSSLSDVTFEISDTEEYYIAPMINITEDASLYLKFGCNFITNSLQFIWLNLRLNPILYH